MHRYFNRRIYIR